MSTVLHVSIERREFLLLAGAAVTGAGLAGCTSTRLTGEPSGGNGPRSPAAVSSPPVSPRSEAGMRLGPQVVHGSRHRSQVALTFHGQGDPAQIRTYRTTLLKSTWPRASLLVRDLFAREQHLHREDRPAPSRRSGWRHQGRLEGGGRTETEPAGVSTEHVALLPECVDAKWRGYRLTTSAGPPM